MRAAPTSNTRVPHNSPMTTSYDAIIIGGGHNGLVCAAYLAGAGLKVRVLERRDVVGGAAVTEEFHPGLPQFDRELHRVACCNPKVIRDLELAAHGLQDRRADARQFPAAAGRRLPQGRRRPDARRARSRGSRARDAERLPEYYASSTRSPTCCARCARDAAQRRRGSWRKRCRNCCAQAGSASA